MWCEFLDFICLEPIPPQPEPESIYPVLEFRKEGLCHRISALMRRLMSRR